MKVGKDGKLKLSKDERRIGSFVIKNEENYIKICDIQSQFSHRVSKLLNIGRQLEMALKEDKTTWLHNYVSMVWNFSNMITDAEFMIDVDNACIACVNRHKEFYGLEEDITPERDAEILKEAQETYEAIEELKKEE